jgi:hypothetical protein
VRGVSVSIKEERKEEEKLKREKLNFNPMHNAIIY